MSVYLAESTTAAYAAATAQGPKQVSRASTGPKNQPKIKKESVHYVQFSSVQFSSNAILSVDRVAHTRGDAAAAYSRQSRLSLGSSGGGGCSWVFGLEFIGYYLLSSIITCRVQRSVPRMLSLIIILQAPSVPAIQFSSGLHWVLFYFFDHYIIN